MSRRAWMLPSEDKIGRSLVQGPSRRSPGAAKRVVPVVAAIAVVAAIISGGAMLLLGGGTSEQLEEAAPGMPSANYGVGIPPPPYVIYGWTYEADGITILPNCAITVTNMRLAMSNVTVSDGTGQYDFDLNLIGGEDDPYLDGDEILVEAVSESGTLYGSATGYVDLSGLPYTRVDVDLITVIPEFPMVIVPVAGMLALFAIVRMRRRDAEA